MSNGTVSNLKTRNDGWPKSSSERVESKLPNLFPPFAFNPFFQDGPVGAQQVELLLADVTFTAAKDTGPLGWAGQLPGTRWLARACLLQLLPQALHRLLQLRACCVRCAIQPILLPRALALTPPA